MSAMTATSTPPRRGLPPGPITRAVLADLPDDGHRYELIDGALIVSAAPRIHHQRVLGALYLLLHDAVPADLEVLFAPVDVVLADDTVVEPDLVIARRSDLTERDLPAAPVLAVEVLSPSTRGIDLLLKKDRLERAGCAHYWVIDPAVPAIRAWALEHGRYTEVGAAQADEALQITTPITVEIVPSRLVG